MGFPPVTLGHLAAGLIHRRLPGPHIWWMALQTARKSSWDVVLSSNALLHCAFLAVFFRLFGCDALESHSQAGHPVLWLAHRSLSKAQISSGGFCERKRTGGGPLLRGGEDLLATGVSYFIIYYFYRFLKSISNLPLFPLKRSPYELLSSSSS